MIAALASLGSRFLLEWSVRAVMLLLCLLSLLLLLR